MRYLAVIVVLFMLCLSGCSGPGRAQKSKHLTYRVSGLYCINCAARLRDHLMKLDGIEDVEVSIKAQKVTVYYEGARLNKSLIKKAIEEAGFRVIKEGG